MRRIPIGRSERQEVTVIWVTKVKGWLAAGTLLTAWCSTECRRVL